LPKRDYRQRKAVSDMPKYIELPQYKYKPSMEEMIREMSDMTYKSPVETIRQQVQAKFEGDVMELIHSYGINVDKDELVKALKYDRDQYRKGFEDGCKGATDRIKAEVAREIFEEIETSLSIENFKGSEVVYAIRAEDYLHYKKKYAEEQE
jgi:hypothetical protein